MNLYSTPYCKFSLRVLEISSNCSEDIGICAGRIVETRGVDEDEMTAVEVEGLCGLDLASLRQ